MMNKKKYKYGIHFSILTAAIVGFIVSFLFDEYPNVFSVLIGITSGAFSYALVAWLIEQGNDKRQTTKDKQVMDALMEKFDSRVKHTLEFGLNNCMILSDEDIKEEYSICQAKYSPFDKDGNGNMGYLYEINRELAKIFIKASIKNNPYLEAEEFINDIMNEGTDD